MSFHLPRDEGRQRVELIRQGKARLEPVFDGFVTRFRESFGIAPLSLLADAPKPPAGRDAVPRLGIVLERSNQYRAFLTPGRGYDPAAQRSIARVFADQCVSVR